jgi:hypothetical protein
MVKLTPSLVTCSAIAFLLFANVAAATTYSNSNDFPLCCLVQNEVTGADNIGQVFNTSGLLLSDWTFYATGGTAGNVKLVVAD